MTNDPWVQRAGALSYYDAWETEGVLSRRVVAYLIDIFCIGVLTAISVVAVLMLSIATFGLLHVLWSVIPFIALIYGTLSLGGPASATPGMRAMGLVYRRIDGGRVDYPIALLVTLLFYATTAATGSLILLVTLFTQGNRALHDILCGLVVVRNQGG